MKGCELGDEVGQRDFAGVDRNDNAHGRDVLDHAFVHAAQAIALGSGQCPAVYPSGVTQPWRSTSIPGVWSTGRPAVEDARGSFTKVMDEGRPSEFAAFEAKEVFWSRSTRGVFRGMHVQLPPREAAKFVFVVEGLVRDFVLDLRRGSPSEGRLLELQLDETSGGLMIPAGCAHGFEVMTEQAVMVYVQSESYSREHDAGVHFASCGVTLLSDASVISERDVSFPPLSDFESPFEFESVHGSS